MALTIDFSGRVALVTGAAKGIGLAAAKAYVNAGAQVALLDRDASVAEVSSSLNASGATTIGMQVDVSNAAQVASAVAETVRALGRLDFALNNAGIGSYGQPVQDVDDSLWQRVIEVNLSGVFYCIKHEVPAMLASGGGVIVNTSSVLGVRALPDTSVQYTAAKHGVIGLTRQVAVNHGHEGIRCLAICPGLVDTTLVDKDSGGGVQGGGLADDALNEIIGRTPLGRIGKPEEIADAVVLLCSDKAAFANGSHLVIDGGLIQG